MLISMVVDAAVEDGNSGNGRRLRLGGLFGAASDFSQAPPTMLVETCAAGGSSCAIVQYRAAVMVCRTSSHCSDQS